MASTSITLCGICEGRHVTKCAEHWCPECEEGLCLDCENYHSLSKSSRNHEIISIENYNKLPTFITDITDHCTEHKLKFTNYCQHHDQLCCPGCINIYHRKCEDLQPLRDLLKNSKTSALTSALGEQLEDMLQFIYRGIKDREKNLLSLNEDQQSIIDGIKTIRSKLNSHLDTLEQFILKKLADRHNKSTSEIKALVKKLYDKSAEIGELHNNLMAVKTYGSDLQTFFGLRYIDDEVNKAAIYLKCTSGGKIFQQVKIVGTINHQVKNIFALTSFGDINEECYPSSIVYKTRNENEAQIMAAWNNIAPKSINNIQLKLLNTFIIPEKEDDHNVWGCTVCPEGKMIFTECQKHRVVFLNADNSYDKDLMIQSGWGPYDVTVIDQKTLAISTGEDIKIIDIDSKTIKDEIKTGGVCDGITYYKDSLLLCETAKGVNLVSLKNKIISTTVKRNLPSLSFLTVYNDKIYLSDYTKRTVECLSIDGREVWTFGDSSILSDPTCVTVDNKMYVYVTSFNSGNVVVISHDGKQGRQLLSKKDGLYKPRGICFDRKTNNILVVNKNGTAFLYHVDYL